MRPRSQRRPRQRNGSKENDENEANRKRTFGPQTPLKSKSTQVPVEISSLPPSSPLPVSSSDPPLPAEHQDPNDPFGFILAEKNLKLKISMTRRVLQPRAIQNTSESVLNAMGVDRGKTLFDGDVLFEEPDDDVGVAFATPTRRVTTPSTPRSASTPTSKPGSGRNSKADRISGKIVSTLSRDGTQQEGSGSDDGTHLLSSSAQGACLDSLSDKSEDLKRRQKSKRKTGKKASKTNRADKESMANTTALLELLPHRPTRHAAGMRTKKARKQSSKGSKAKHKAEVIGEGEGESYVLDDEEREKFAIERAARIEYFKQLDGYEVAKENVYII